MALDRQEMETIAQLARLHINEADIQEVGARITEILALVDRMQAVDTRAVTPLAHPFDAVQKLRPDEVTEGDQRDALQRFAPDAEDGLYRVPRVIE